MKEKEYNKTMPELRFPGFEGDWKETKFKNITSPAGEKNTNNLPYERYSISNEFGFYPQNEQFEGGGGYLKDIDCSRHTIVAPHSFAYNPARINVGSIGYQNLDKEVIISPLYEVFQTTKDCDDAFLWQWLHSNIFHKIVINTQEGGVRQCFSYSKLCDCSIFLPPTLAEQQKIADCLSALDEQISAQQQKVESLKAHKRGLMQQLFPQPGETTPQRRFPGFSGEWVEKKLGDECEVTDYVASGSFADLHKNVVYQTRPDYAVLVRVADNSYGFDPEKFIYINKHAYDFLRKSNLKRGDIIISNVGSCGVVFRCPDLGQPMSLAPNAILVKTTNDNFYYQLFASKIGQSKILGIVSQSAMPKFNKTDFKGITIPVPPTQEEQQKIADCLSALDENIAAEQQKVELLKAHKKGLMQQLFPPME